MECPNSAIWPKPGCLWLFYHQPNKTKNLIKVELINSPKSCQTVGKIDAILSLILDAWYEKGQKCQDAEQNIKWCYKIMWITAEID